jgi:hypothetical protein
MTKTLTPDLDTDWQASAETLRALEAEIPLLSAVREFTERAAAGALVC